MSPQRIDYYDSPEAPRANSLVPAVNMVVVNDAGEILLIRRTDNGNWALPGGAIDLGESVAQAAVRETLEESGIECAITGRSGSPGEFQPWATTDPGVTVSRHRALPALTARSR